MIISVVVIIVVALVGYGVYASMQKGSSQSNLTAADQGAGQQAANGTQVQGQDIKVGTGREATPGSVVSVLYVGKFTDGTVFDSSAANGGEPLVFTLGQEGIIPGFQIGVNGMREGGERLLAIPPELGYGAQDVKDKDGKVVIPGNSTLVFDVQLVTVQDAPSAGATTSAAAKVE